MDPRDSVSSPALVEPEVISTEKRPRIHEYLSFRAEVKTDAGMAAAAHTDKSKVRFARHSGATLLEM
jgi:hypothetical protein